MKAKCLSEKETSKLSVTLLTGIFWATLTYSLDITPGDFHLYVDGNHYNDNDVVITP